MIWLDAQGIKVEYLRSKIKIESRREIPWGEKNGESLRGSGTAGASLTESAGGIRAKVASPLKSAKNGDSASGNGKERVSGMIMRDGCSAIIAIEVSLSLGREPTRLVFERMYGIGSEFRDFFSLFSFFFDASSHRRDRCRTPRCVNGTRSRGREDDRPSCVVHACIRRTWTFHYRALASPDRWSPSILLVSPFLVCQLENP